MSFTGYEKKWPVNSAITTRSDDVTVKSTTSSEVFSEITPLPGTAQKGFMLEPAEAIKLDCLYYHIFSNTDFLSPLLLLRNFNSPENWSCRVLFWFRFFGFLFQKATEKISPVLGMCFNGL